MSKSRDAFRTISEVAEWLDTPAHVLRFWESKFTQVKPVKRAGGRRYYRPADMQLLGGIKKLLHDDGLTIKGAQKLLREHGVKHVAALSQALDPELEEEAGFVENAEPIEAEPAPTVIDFKRPETETPPKVIVDEDMAPIETPDIREPEPADPPVPDADVSQNTFEFDAPQTASDPETEAPTAPIVEEQAEDLQQEEQPAQDAQPQTPAAFGSDDLPAFMRTPLTSDQPAPDPNDSEPQDQPVSDAQHAALTNAPNAPESQAKVTIDPVAQFVPMPEDEVEDDTTAQSAPVSDPAPQAPVDSTPTAEDPKPIARDVPSIAKIAPELDSFTPDPGVLSAAKGAKTYSLEDARDMQPLLYELRALRKRMIDFGHQ